ncbi:MAG: hypothetical protein B7Y80_01870 [Hyphomicrobium sp. 32-62-53]|nr:MAG: hypothetical protein B7Z29_02220 [Hyphomicrobium sp. 12-62-95]OYY01496.1 MAG: hypothetical protein B7Y80_01870 [Hyphomicrobium sp. 32-62-53]
MTPFHVIPLAAVLMFSTSAVAQETPQQPATPPAATEPTPASPEPATPAPPAVQQAPAEIPAPTAEATQAPVLTDDQARALKNKVVWSSDQKNVGEVADIVRDSDGRIKELHADIGGFLGFGETRVRVAPDEFRMMDDRIVLTRTQAQVETLPQVIEN